MANIAGNAATAVPRHRVDPAVAARRAGDCGRVTAPLTTGRRIIRYLDQNGCRKLSPKQRRRVEQKERRAHKLAEIAGNKRWDRADLSWMDGEPR